jgi:hypothetical protein
MASLDDEDRMCRHPDNIGCLIPSAKMVLNKLDPHFGPVLKRSVVDTIQDEPRCDRSETLAKDVMNQVTVGELRIIAQQMLDSDQDKKITTREEFLSQFLSLCFEQIEKPLR